MITVCPVISKLDQSFGHYVKDCQYIILWNQRANDPNTLKMPVLLEHINLKRKTVIILTPLPNRLVKINIQGEEIGPILSNMVVPLDILSLLIPYTYMGSPGVL